MEEHTHYHGTTRKQSPPRPIPARKPRTAPAPTTATEPRPRTTAPHPRPCTTHCMAQATRAHTTCCTHERRRSHVNYLPERWRSGGEGNPSTPEAPPQRYEGPQVEANHCGQSSSPGTRRRAWEAPQRLTPGSREQHSQQGRKRPTSNFRNRALLRKPNSHFRNRALLRNPNSHFRNRALLRKPNSHFRNRALLRNPNSHFRNRALLRKPNSHFRNRALLRDPT